MPVTLTMAPGPLHDSTGMGMAFSQVQAGTFCNIFPLSGLLQLSDAPLETETPAWEAAGIHSTVAFRWPVHARESPGWDLCGTSGRQAEQTRMGESTPAQTALGMGLTSG